MANTTIYPYGTGGSIPSSIGIINDLVTGGADKALSAEQGKVLNDNLSQLGQKVGVKVNENGWFLVDEQLNVALKYDTDGLDVAKVSDHFKNLLGGGGGGGDFIQVVEDGFFVVDENLNIGVYIDANGIHANNIIEYQIVNL